VNFHRADDSIEAMTARFEQFGRDIVARFE
jgi:hypothetical protein